MGLHKRIISKEIIINLYQNYGLESVISYINGNDILISSDEFSKKIIDFIVGVDMNDRVKRNIEFEIVLHNIKEGEIGE